MHPLFFWSISVADLAERQREEAVLQAQRDSGVVQPPPLTRDDRWRAAIRRWAAAEPPQAATPAAPAAPAPRLGCA
ncbi:hypothetical protein [Leifsonia sp. 21MFCrub1.1]|uniref:hypothetical protein n=1 Tax=Leifsonia sp. 21MFCrub1.1 TaxID=1798223 RepID=UPI000892950A|nr:hypothetical protein [Leifsonia sp. 21MFCrub1.1]SEA84456.1 hypothetical protein SAMN04515680_1794 [Leifsonia sp. 21MFCrub1.1]